MSRSDASSSITRRSLLKTAALSSGAVMVPGFLGATSLDSKKRREIRRVGLLLSDNHLLAESTAEVERRLRGRLSTWLRNASGIEIVLRRTTGSSPAARRALEELFHEESADHVFCFLSNLVAPTIGEVASQLRRPVTLINAGAHSVNPIAMSNWLHVMTLDLFGRNRDVGQAAANRGFRRGLVLTTTTEAGYGTVEAIRQGFETGEGVIDRYVILDSPQTGKIDHNAIKAVVADLGPEVVFVLAHQERDREWLQEISSLLASFSAPIVRNETVATEDIFALVDRAIDELLNDDLGKDSTGGSSSVSYHVWGSHDKVGGVPVPYV